MKIRILIADDHAIVRYGLASLITTQPDMEVVGQAKNGKEAVALALATHPDIVVMDLAMPKLDGAAARASSRPTSRSSSRPIPRSPNSRRGRRTTSPDKPPNAQTSKHPNTQTPKRPNIQTQNFPEPTAGPGRRRGRRTTGH